MVKKENTGMGRREFLQRLGALFCLPMLRLGFVDTGVAVDVPPVNERWLAEWQAAKRIPIVESHDELERRVLRAIRVGEAVSIVYAGGTRPGEVRRVRPAMLYRVEGFGGAYLTGYCEARGDIRTFRLDRVRLVV